MGKKKSKSTEKETEYPLFRISSNNNLGPILVFALKKSKNWGINKWNDYNKRLALNIL